VGRLGVNMSIGYTYRIARLNKEADSKKLGVKLGKVCITEGISVVDLADKFNVSRQTIYNWFIGECEPKENKQESIKAYLQSFS